MKQSTLPEATPQPAKLTHAAETKEQRKKRRGLEKSRRQMLEKGLSIGQRDACWSASSCPTLSWH
jgi:hypothetical protein